MDQSLFIVAFWSMAALWLLATLHLARLVATAAEIQSLPGAWKRFTEPVSRRASSLPADRRRGLQQQLEQGIETERAAAINLGGLALATWGIVVTLGETSSTEPTKVASQLLLTGAVLTLLGPLLVPQAGLPSGYLTVYVTRSVGFGAIVLAIGALAPLSFPDDWRQVAVKIAIVAAFAVAELHRLKTFYRWIHGYFPPPKDPPTEVGGSPMSVSDIMDDG